MKRLLIVVDYQYDFVSGALGFEGAEKLEEAIYGLVKEAEACGDEIIFTKDIHGNDYMDTEEGKNLPVPHCIQGSGGEEFYGRIKKLAARHLVFEKETFGSLRLGDFIAKHKYDRIDLCGIDLSICVLANAVIAKAAAPNAHIAILLNASGTGDDVARAHAIASAKRLHIEIAE